MTLFIPVLAAAEEVIRLDDILKEAEANSPRLAAMKDKYQAAYERVPQAGALPDPMFGIGVQNLPVDTLSFRQDMMTSKMVELSQEFPFFGKRRLKAEAAWAEARAMEDEYAEEALTLRSDIRMAVYELYMDKKGLEVLDRSRELLDALGKAVQARYSVGGGSLKDVIKVQLESSMLLEKKIALEKEEHTKRAYLGSLLGRDIPVSGEVEDITPTEITASRDALVEEALRQRPALKSAGERIKKGTLMVEMARKEYYPDFTVKADYMQRDRLKNGMDQSDMISVMLSVNLPVWRNAKLAPAVREAEFMKSMAEDEREARVKDIRYRVDSLLGEIEQGERTMKLYKEVVVPEANDEINAGLAGYETGKGELMGLLDSMRMLLDYQMGYYRALASREKAVAELGVVIGKEFTTMPVPATVTK
ncbi:MAG: TolC family protein [Nitrospirota bacterium]